MPQIHTPNTPVTIHSTHTHAHVDIGSSSLWVTDQVANSQINARVLLIVHHFAPTIQQQLLIHHVASFCSHRTVSSSIDRQGEVLLVEKCRGREYTSLIIINEWTCVFLSLLFIIMQLLPGVTLLLQIPESLTLRNNNHLSTDVAFPVSVHETFKERPFPSGRWRLSPSEREVLLWWIRFCLWCGLNVNCRSYSISAAGLTSAETVIKVSALLLSFRHTVFTLLCCYLLPQGLWTERVQTETRGVLCLLCCEPERRPEVLTLLGCLSVHLSLCPSALLSWVQYLRYLCSDVV